jgi:YidC/Oxa1 family membrane protein insertase
MSNIYNAVIFRPLYNGLVGIMDVLPWIDVGMAVIIFTVIVKLILYPLSKSALLTQVRMREIEPEAAKIRAQYSTDRQAQALKIMELYKAKGVRPFSGILLLIIQLPILLSIISVFYKIIPVLQTNLLYSFVSAPDLTDRLNFLGLINLTTPSLSLALVTAAVQFLQIKYSFASQQAAPVPGAAANATTQFAATMNTQMKYLVPILAFVSIYWIIPASFPQASSIIAIYWMTSSLMTFLQELMIRRKYAKKA